MKRVLIGGAMAVLLAGCASAPQRSAGDVAAQTACRERADEVYAKQNRAELYNADRFASSGRDSPFATATVADLPSRGLSGEYERDTMVSDCLAGTGAATTGASSGNAAPSPPSDAPPPPGQP